MTPRLPPKWGFSSSMWNDFFLRRSDPSPGSSRSCQDESDWAPGSVSRGLFCLQMQLLLFEAAKGPALIHSGLST